MKNINDLFLDEDSVELDDQIEQYHVKQAKIDKIMASKASEYLCKISRQYLILNEYFNFDFNINLVNFYPFSDLNVELYIAKIITVLSFIENSIIKIFTPRYTELDLSLILSHSIYQETYYHYKSATNTH